MKVGPGKSCTGSLYSGPLPTNGVIYASNAAGCTGEYSPLNVSYESTTTNPCGNINIEGTYSKPLTIAAANDVMIMNNLAKTNEEAMLGLIANNFIRVYHPVELSGGTCSATSNNLTGSITEVKIEAALLAINHSFIVPGLISVLTSCTVGFVLAEALL